MSTAARPTYFSAIGKPTVGGIPSRFLSGKDQTAHTKLKFRQVGQATETEMKEKDLKHELSKKEAEISLDKRDAIAMIENEEKKVDVTLLLKDKPEINEEVLKKYDDADIDAGSSDGFDSSRYKFRKCLYDLINSLLKVTKKMTRKMTRKHLCVSWRRSRRKKRQH